MIEYFGWILWLSSIAFEHTADLQKKKFVRDCIKNKIKNAVCDVGLWRYRYIFDIYCPIFWIVEILNTNTKY